MKKLFSSVLLIVITFVIITSCSRRDENEEITQIVDKYGSSVVTIITDKAQGSGVIVSSDGKIVTNHHVINGATSAYIKIPRGGTFFVEGILVLQPENDIAIIKIDGEDLTSAKFGNSKTVKQGDAVIAIGTPKGLENTVTDGIISRIEVKTEKLNISTFQTSASIDHGNSGGGLFNMRGELIGINTLSMTKDKIDASFAIPINAVKDLLSVNSIKVKYKTNESIKNRFGDDDHMENDGINVFLPMLSTMASRVVAFSIVLFIFWIMTYFGFKISLKKGKSLQNTYLFWSLILFLTGIWSNGYMMFADLTAEESFGVSEIFTKMPLFTNIIFWVGVLVLIVTILKKRK